MKSSIFRILIGLAIATPMSVWGATKTHHRAHKKAHTKMVKKTPAIAGAKLQTDIEFNDSVLRGRYQSPDEAVARVEREKALDDLLSVRKDFKDRLKQARDEN